MSFEFYAILSFVMLKFVATGELGRLAKWLRILGYDTEYNPDKNGRELIIKSLKGRRIVLTRDLKMSRFSGIKVVYLKSDFVEKQIAQLRKEMPLKIDENKFFSICVLCNKPLEDIEKEKVKNNVPEYVYRTQNVFKRCSFCKRVYWKGTHWENVEKFIRNLEIKNE